MPGKRISAYAFIALVLAAFLAWPVYTYATYRGEKIRPEGFNADTSWSSGKLSKAHAELANDCQACHTDAFVAVRDTACVACHTDSHQGEAAGLQRVALSGPRSMHRSAEGSRVGRESSDADRPWCRRDVAGAQTGVPAISGRVDRPPRGPRA